MDLSSFHRDILTEGFSEEIALYTTVILALNYTTKPKAKDLADNGRYTKRLRKKMDTVLRELPDENRQTCLNLWGIFPLYNVRKDMDGLGGCTKATLRELLKDIEDVP